MAEAIDWLPDGTPFSPRFGDRYHSSANQGLDQARATFLQGCDLPEAWAGQAQWRILETGFGLGLNFLVTWAAWRNDPARPRLLHFVSCEAWPVSAGDLLRAAPQDPELQPLAAQLAEQWWGLLPGVHRLAFEDGQVLLTLYIGDAATLLRQQQPLVDTVYLDGFSPRCNPDMWNSELIKAVARCCQRGTRLATWSVAASLRAQLTSCGFEVRKVPGTPPKRDNLQARYAPAWTLRAAPATEPPLFATPSHCVVVGSGLAGAGAAASLARRGWQVSVLDQGDTPAAGASGLPAGLFAPHTSPDDAPLSRLSRAGVRWVRQVAQMLLTSGQDWAPSGVLEHCVDGRLSLPPDWHAHDHPGHDWSHPADRAYTHTAGLGEDSVAQWHACGGWIRPAHLAAALLAQPGISWHGGVQVARITRSHTAPTADPGAMAPWQLWNAAGELLAEAPLVVLATGAGSIPLCADLVRPGTLRPLRGQVSWGWADLAPALPPFPVNGHGNLVPQAYSPQGPLWVLGSTFERGQTDLPKSAEDIAAGRLYNQQRLANLIPGLAAPLQALFERPGAVHDWAAVRCTTPDRLPVVGPLQRQALPGLCISTALGARGLTLALLCGELMAAWLHAEPLPIEAKLAQALRAERLSL